ncbi:hypothetical protein AN643_03965 [Candidatus Epulonipiscioides saccharophilum]|nr:hypothetical protein AN643_03965 [Epulopiscium sp. SCG-B10WGA-EpuloB]
MDEATEKVFLYQEILTLNQPAPLVISSIKMKQYKLAQGFRGDGVSYRNDALETMYDYLILVFQWSQVDAKQTDRIAG